ncbi:hypothetical protein NX059_006873 [Plenodomus lindquistii]|nr:hypothetical protein NX059_006873 [Plenodomus lindquistii]
MQPPLPSPTATWHNATYAAIDPTNPDLSQAGKTVIITGAGSGIGRATALAFAKAGAAHLILIGRTESTLKETQGLVAASNAASSKVSMFSASVTDEAKVKDIASQIGAWDVLILGAAHISPPSSIVETSLQKWWADYETNVKSVVIAAQAFVPNAKPGAAIYGLTSGAASLPPAYTPTLSGYLTSKISQIKVLEFLAAEHPELFICSVHPGMVETDVFKGSGGDATQLPMDSAELPASFLVWLSQPKNKYLQGKTVWANWDVEELGARAEEIKSSALFTLGFGGWPYSPATA